jgi:hypothetical protein
MYSHGCTPFNSFTALGCHLQLKYSFPLPVYKFITPVRYNNSEPVPCPGSPLHPVQKAMHWPIIKKQILPLASCSLVFFAIIAPGNLPLVPRGTLTAFFLIAELYFSKSAALPLNNDYEPVNGSCIFKM